MSAVDNWQQWPEAIAIKAVASSMNRGKLKFNSKTLANLINLELERRQLRVALFLHGGIWDVGLMPPEEEQRE